MKSNTRASLAAGLLVLLVVACATAVPSASPSPSPTSNNISAARAIELAREHATMTYVVDATSGTYGDLKLIPADQSTPDDLLVWAVRFSGDVTICPPDEACLSPRPATSTVYLDYFSGAFVGTSTVSLP